MTNRVLGLIALIASLSATAAVNQSGADYFTVEEAVIAAADAYNPISIQEDREYMGTIFRSNNRYGYTVTRGSARANSISIRVTAESWDDVVAFWHTHGNAAPNNRYFSRVDTETAERFDKPFYLADYTGFLKVFRPGQNTMTPFAARRLGLPGERGYATGEFVRNQFNQTVRINTRFSQICS
ncbi:MAG: DUF4329 domain-containing protein [Pseudomonadales bacterium]|nr:DUF4329 domain-containing protein [Pseudomonadales bacterium]